MTQLTSPRLLAAHVFTKIGDKALVKISAGQVIIQWYRGSGTLNVMGGFEVPHQIELQADGDTTPAMLPMLIGVTTPESAREMLTWQPTALDEMLASAVEIFTERQETRH